MNFQLELKTASTRTASQTAHQNTLPGSDQNFGGQSDGHAAYIWDHCSALPRERSQAREQRRQLSPAAMHPEN